MKRLIYLWNHKNEIIEGWANYFYLKYFTWKAHKERKKRFNTGREENPMFKSLKDVPSMNEVSEARLAVCNTCPFRQSYKEGNVATWEKKVEDDKCGLCGCPLKVKTLAMTEAKWGEGGCPKKLW